MTNWLLRTFIKNSDHPEDPKVRAAVKFARSRKGRTCIIGALDKAAETMAGLSGTRIHE